jgi:hypothetical protein
VRVCNEEAATANTGTIYESGRTTKPAAAAMPAAGRLDFPPLDNAYGTANNGASV